MVESKVSALSAPKSSDEGVPLWREVVRWVLTALGLYVAAFWMLGWIYSGRPWWPSLHDKPNMYDLSRSSAAMAGILGGAAAIAVALRRQRSTEKSVRIAAEAQRTSADAQQTAALAQEVAAAAQRVDADAYRLDLRRTENDRVTALRSRYTEAARQLGDPSAAVRLAGAYAMAALADDWITRNDEMQQTEGAAWVRDPDAQACIDVLCAYIRTPRRHMGDQAPTDPTDEGDATEYLADREVRQTIIRITRDHLRKDPPRPWSGYNLDYTGATVAGRYDFSGIVVDRGIAINFASAAFEDGVVDFREAQFEKGGTVSFEDTLFGGARVLFDGATFAGGKVNFLLTRFVAGDVSFDSAEVVKPGLRFNQPTFAGSDVTFGAHFAGPRACYIWKPEFAGGSVTFDAAVFAGELRLQHPEFADGQVSFEGAEFYEGGSVQFKRPAVRHGAEFPSGPWPHPPPWPQGCKSGFTWPLDRGGAAS